MSKRARKKAMKLETAKRNARKNNTAALAAVPRKYCKNRCGKSYKATSKAVFDRHKKKCKWVWDPGENTGVPVTVPEASAVLAVTGVDVLMAAAAAAP